jgi:hypothetical protein
MPRGDVHPARLVILALLACGIVGVRAANACQCLSPGPACQTMWQAPTVFAGEVVSIDDVTEPSGIATLPAFPMRRVHLRVREAFRGTRADKVDVLTGRGGGDCGYPFSVGASYVVHAYPQPDGTLGTGICEPTKLLSEATADLAYLRAVPSTNDAHGRIFGTARFWDEVVSGTSPPRTGYAGATVTATGPGGRFAAVTGADGAYEILAPVGDYDISVQVEATRYAVVGTLHVTVPNSLACTESDVSVHSDGHIAGRVVDVQHHPIGDLTVEVGLVPQGTQAPVTPRYAARTAADGAFVVTQIPPGLYEVGFNMNRNVTGVWPYPRVLHGSLASQDPITLTMGSGAQVTIGDFVVPPDIEIVHMTGVVQREDHATVTGTRIYLEADDNNRLILIGAPVVASSDGAFSIAVVSGCRYRVVAEQTQTDASGQRSLLRSDVVPITAAHDLAPLKLTLTKR